MGIKTLKITSQVTIKETGEKATVADISGNVYYLEGRKEQYRIGDLLIEKKKTQLKNKANTSISQMSDLTRALNKIYIPYSRLWLQHNRMCRAQLDGCNAFATECHHMYLREGFWLIVSKYFFPICRRCHRKITKNSKNAINRGISISRHANLEYEFNEMEKEMIMKAGLSLPDDTIHI